MTDIVVNAPSRRKMADPAAFFSGVRKVTGPLAPEQVTTISRLLIEAGYWCIGWLAYGLATAWHEARLVPQAEWGHGNGHFYAQPGARSSHTIGPTYGGQSPYGRGLVQLTWCDNYEWADKTLGLNGALLKNFDLALDPDIAARILVAGMEDGAFTGKKLADYITDRGTPASFTAARWIINAQDRAGMIAGYAETFQDAADAGGWG